MICECLQRHRMQLRAWFHAAPFAFLFCLCPGLALAAANDCPAPINGTLMGGAGNNQDNMFRSLTVDPTDERIVYAGTETNGIFKTTDGGLTWTRLRNGLKCTASQTFYPEIYDMAVDPLNHNTVYAATVTGPGPASPESFPSASAGVYKSTDGGQTWVQKNSGLPNTYVTSVLVDSQRPGRIYAVVGGLLSSFPAGSSTFYYGGLYVSDNGGETWSALTLPSGAERNTFSDAMLTGADQRAIYLSGQVHQNDANQAMGFMRSGDGGATWTVSNPSGQIISHFDVSKQNDNLIFANTTSGSRVRKSEDGGVTWISIGPTIFFGALKIHPTNSQIVYYPGSPNGTIWRTLDGFATVQQVYADLTLQPGQIVADIEIAPSNPNVVWVAVNGYYLYRSTDGGTSWTKITAVRDAVYGAAASGITNTQASTVAPVAFSTKTSPLSFVRIFNPTGSIGTAEIFVRDQAGVLLGSYTRQIPGNAAPQIGMAEIESQANFIPPAGASALAQIEVRGNFTGFLQHVTYDLATGRLANLSVCKPGQENPNAGDIGRKWVSNAHTSRLTSHPSKIAVLSGENTATSVTLRAYDATTGQAVGQWISPSIPALGALIMPVSQIEQQMGFSPAPTQYHLNFQLADTSHVLLAHLVTNLNGESDMTTRCPL